MKAYLTAFAAALICYAVMDLLWVGVAAHQIYQEALGHLMAASVRWGAVVLFYPLYAAGVVFFAWERLPYNHAIWHVFVLAGSLCHCLAVALFV